jgi:hypothetical protein
MRSECTPVTPADPRVRAHAAHCVSGIFWNRQSEHHRHTFVNHYLADLVSTLLNVNCEGLRYVRIDVLKALRK